MATSPISAVTITLSIAFGFVGGADSTQPSAKDQKRMPDGKEWTTAKGGAGSKDPAYFALR
jgi:hypothetical protein